MKTEKAPFDLAPRRKRPLTLWNPLDYLVVLRWFLFFPQAIPWYVERFASGGEPSALRWLSDRVRRRFLVQAVVAGWIMLLALMALAFFAAFWLLIKAAQIPPLGPDPAERASGTVSYWFGFGFGGLIAAVELGLVAAIFLSFTNLSGRRQAEGLAMVLRVMTLVMPLYSLLMVLFLVFVALWSERPQEPWAGIVATPVLLLENLVLHLLIAGFLGLRIPGWLVSLAIPAKRFWNRVIWLPLPWIEERLVCRLEEDWEEGLAEVHRVWTYSLQLLPAVAAVSAVLERTPREDLLPRVAALADSATGQRMLRFGSESLGGFLWNAAVDGLFWIPSRWRRTWRGRAPAGLRTDTPARQACAGFWLIGRGETRAAAEVLARLRAHPFGGELHGIAAGLAEAEEARDLEDLSSWHDHSLWLTALPPACLRPQTVEDLRTLRDVAAGVAAALRAASPLNRAAALGRATASLQRLAEEARHGHSPEAPAIWRAAQVWLSLVIRAGGEVGDEVARRPVANPYEGYSGLPVTGSTFVGRADIFREIEARWASSDLLPAIFLYGHRRMGKTSILRNLETAVTPGTLLVFLDMQDAGLVDHTGQLLRDVAEAVHRRVSEAGLDLGAPPLPERFGTLGEARREVNLLLERLAPRMEQRRLVLAIDEFEIVEKGIGAGRIDAGFPGYLRSLNQSYRWLGLIFGGLHTLDEMGRDYRQAFFGQAEHVRVGYLRRDDAVRLITRPSPDFALEYEPDLLAALLSLTSGQPYLVQRVCWELVRRWNERFLAEGESLPRLLGLDDLAPVLDDDLYAGAAYYFDGVWSNVTAEERRLMQRMAVRPGSWSLAELNGGGVAIEETLGLLDRHDVVVREEGGVRFASELMRRWVDAHLR